MTLQRLKVGELFRPQAKTWNAFADAAEDFQRRLGSQRSGPVGTATSAGIVTIKNISGANVPRFGTLAVDGIVIDPADNLPEFKARPVFTADAPDEANKSRLVITQEPIAAGTFGRAMVMGVTAVQIDVQDEDHSFAEAAEGDTAKLISGAAGLCRILWKAEGIGIKWAWVQMPVGGVGEPITRLVSATGFTAGVYTGTGVDGIDTASFDFTIPLATSATQIIPTGAAVLIARKVSGETTTWIGVLSPFGVYK